MHVLFLHTAREWSGTARLFARAGRGISERGAKVTLLVTPDSNVHLAVSPRRDPGQPRHTPIPEPFEIIPFATDGWAFVAAHPNDYQLEPLPPYAPELNPEELCNGAVKQELQNAVPGAVAEL